jgi:hypothetical protein
MPPCATVDPYSAQPLSCVYAKNARGYSLNLQHCGKKMVFSSVFKIAH